ncbi:aminopeptidase Ey-like [Cimex lectularius]|uniref:Aminopeptidase n=1 Tax=Cimex lectularius TaxID=79782 RepID=A0A8I6SE36_CIMLE|nr:aminopeptidase Ey-like [Cimex lectularius]
MEKILLLFVIGIFTCMGTRVQIDDNSSPFWIYWKPFRYSLDIVMDIQHKSFEGKVKIAGVILKDTDKLGLHCRVNISEGFYTLKGNNKFINLSLASKNVNSDSIFLNLDQTLRKDVEFMLTLRYNGLMQNLTGLYMSFYRFNNEKRTVISTEFQPMGARWVFPCIDIPSYKAVFELKVGRPQTMNALSNMPIKSTSPPDSGINGQVWDVFHPSPKMSTYVLTFLIYDTLTNLTLQNNNTIWYPNEIKRHIQLTSEIMVMLRDQMEKYTGIKYVLPKLDLAVVPEKAPIAMESWGLITWRYSHISAEERKIFVREELEFVVYMAHEIAHQWFGNLVTCRYWCYLWLNEGITSYIMNQIVDQVLPNSNAMDIFTLDIIDYTMNQDTYVPFSLVEQDYCERQTMRLPMSLNIYLKGAAILHMVRKIIMTDDMFKEGLQKFLMDNQFDSVTEKELWEAMQAKMNETEIPEGESLETLMYAWTHNRGFPLLNVYRHTDNGSIAIKQEAFYLFEKDASYKSYLWIPLTYTTSKEKNFENVHLKEWLRPTSDLQPLAVTITEDDWIILNLQNAGYYKINYDQRTWQLITAHLMSDRMEEIHPLNRGQIINDAFQLAKAGLLNYSVVLNLSRYLKNELHYYPLYLGIMSIQSLFPFVKTAGNYYKNYMKYLVSNIYKHVTSDEFNVTDVVSHSLKIMIIELGCTLDFQHCKNQVMQIVDSVINKDLNENQLNLELMESFWCTAAKTGTEKVFNYIKHKYIEEKQTVLKQIYLNSLFCVRSRNIFNSLLNDIFHKVKYIKDIDPKFIMTRIISPYTACYLIDYFFENFEIIVSNYGNNKVIEYLNEIFITTDKEECKNKLKDLVGKRSIPIQLNNKSDWVNRFRDVIFWFEKQNFDIESGPEEEKNCGNSKNVFIEKNINFFKVTNE